MTDSSKTDGDVLIMKAGEAELHIYRHGAHVTYWRAANGVEVIYLSPDAILDNKTKAIRGGVPICWPQFSDFGPLTMSHGFVRIADWEPKAVKQVDETTTEAILELTSDSLAKAGLLTTLKKNAAADILHREFILQYIVTLSANNLRMQLVVQHVDGDNTSPLEFTCALHTYFNLAPPAANISQLRISGLDHYGYADNLQQRAMQNAKPISLISEEVDRNYFNVKNPVVLRYPASTPKNQKTNESNDGVTVQEKSVASTEKKDVEITIVGENFPDVVLWNPWVEKSKGMADLPDDGYQQFVCVESGAIGSKVVLEQGKTWSAAQVLSAEIVGASKL